jgi:hypothetical protein
MSAKANQSGGAQMGYIGGESRNQRYLLPETIDDYIGEDNAVRFVDAFVEPYGDRRGMVEDDWGNTWQIATHRTGAQR